MNIIYIVLGITTISFLLAYIKTIKKLSSVSAGFADLYLNYTALMQAKLSSKEDVNDLNIEHKENFIKFLSDSRDWAYQYIEQVQDGLGKFLDEVEPSIEHFDKYGIVVEGSPHYNDMIKMSKAVKELKKLLPEDPND